MATITKQYTFVDNIMIDASEINRNFDDIINTINGSINSANIATTFSIDGSQVAINDTATVFTATTVEGAIKENYDFIKEAFRGYNSIQECGFHSQGMKIYAGRIEINGKLRYLGTDISWTASDTIMVTGSLDANKNVGSSNLYCLAIRNATSQNIANSDIGLALYSDTSASNGIDVSSNGIYFSGSYTGSKTWRCVSILANLSAASGGLASMKHLAPTGFLPKLVFSPCQTSGIGFRNLASTASGFNAFTQTTSLPGIMECGRTVDRNDGSYIYKIGVKTSITGVNTTSCYGKVWALGYSTNPKFYDLIEGSEWFQAIDSSTETFVFGPPRANETHFLNTGTDFNQWQLNAGATGTLELATFYGNSAQSSYFRVSYAVKEV